MAVELASAYVSLIPSLKGASKSITSQLGGVDVTPAASKIGSSLSKGIGSSLKLESVGAQFTKLGGQITGVGKKLNKGITLPVVGATTAAAGLVGVLGFKRLVGIDTARGQFKGLGYDADKVMEQVDKGVTNTALSMADGASMAVGILATGAVPMEKLEDQIKRTANVSAAYGVEGSHAANLLNAVLTKNKVTYGDLSQMQANGIPIISQLADHYGVAGDEIEKMARKGKISIDDMNKVIDKNAGAAAEEYGKTWAGVTANIKSNLGRLGAEVLDGVFPKLKSQAEDFLQVLKSDQAKAFAQQLGGALTDAFTKISGAIKGTIEWFTGLSPVMQKTVLGVAGFAVAAGPMLIAIGKIATGIGAVLTTGGAVIGGIKKAIPVVKTLNAVMKANVFGIVVTAIAAVVAGLVWFFTQTDIGREIWGGFVNWLKDLWQGVSEFFSGVWEGIVSIAQGAYDWFMSTFGPGLQAVWDGIVSGAKALWEMLEPVFNSGIEMFQAFFDFVSNLAKGFGVFLEALWLGVKASFSGIWEGLKAVWDFIGPMLIDEITARWDAFVSGVSTLWEGIKILWDGLWSAIKAIWEVVGPALMDAMKVAWEGFKNAFAIIWETITGVFSGALDVIKGIFDFFTALFTGDWQGMWDAIKDIVAGVWKIISSVVKGAIDYVWNVIKTVAGTISAFWSSIWSSISSFFAGIWDGISSAVTTAINYVRSRISVGVALIQGIWNRVWSSIKDFFARIWGNIVSAASEFIGSVKSTFSDALDYISGIPGTVVGYFSDLGSRLLESGKSLISGFVRGIKEGFGKAIGAVKDGLDRVRSFFPFSPAKEGPFSGRGWVAYSGVSVGKTFTESVADSLSDGRKAISGELDTMQKDFDREAEAGFTVRAAVPAVADADASGTAGAGGVTIHVDHMEVRDESDIKLIGQDLWTRANRAGRARGRFDLGGAVTP